MEKGRETKYWSLCFKEHLLPEHPKYPAHSIEKLLKALPAMIGKDYWLNISKTGNGKRFVVSYFDDEKAKFLLGKKIGSHKRASFLSKSLSEAIARMVLWCIKEGHIKV